MLVIIYRSIDKLSRVCPSAKLYFVRKKLILVLLVIISFVLLGVLYFAGIFKPKGAGILINTDQPSSVYVNSEQIGSTPFEQILDPGEVEVKLIPQSFEKPLSPYETKVVLVSGIQTVIEREFAETLDGSSGETVSFEKGPNDESSIVVISDPEGAQVEIDGIVKGFTSYKSSDITEGLHTARISANGYNERISEVKTKKGYKLTLFVKLSKIPVVEEEKEKTQEEIKEQPTKVEILQTPTGFLRVRQEPSTVSPEVAKVEPGETYEVIEQSEDGEWIKIKGDDDIEGWVSKEYTKEVETKTEEDIEAI